MGVLSIGIAAAGSSAGGPPHSTADSVAPSASPSQTNAVLSADDRNVLDYLKGTTINVSHTDGGGGWAKYQLTPRTYIAGRAEYLSDRGGLFSGVTEALKEVTATYDFTLANGFDMKYEYRRDWSNVPIFLTRQQGVFSKDQDTATLGVIWWFGRKQGEW
jgi:hypothetical protein